MLKTKTILCLLIVFQIKLMCQTSTFEYLLSTQLNEVAQDIYESDSGEIYIAGFVSKPNQFWGNTNGFVMKIDKDGHLIDSSEILFPGSRYCITGLLSQSNDSLILIGYSSDTIQEFVGFKNSRLELRMMNRSLDIIYHKSHPLPSNYEYCFSSSTIGLNKDILLGVTYKAWQFNFIFYVFNNAFDSLMAMDYTDNNRFCGPIKQLNDTTYWVCDDTKSNYYVLNEELNITTYEYARPHSINSPYGIKWDTDTSFYMTGEWNGGNDHDIGLYKQIHPIDSTNSLFKNWGTPKLDIPAPSGLDFKNKDSIYIGGTTNFWFYYLQEPSWYYVLQTDSNLNIRWERFYGGDAYYMMQKIIASNDGGCIIAGTRYDYQNVTEEELDIHVLKLTSEGLLVSTPEQPGIEMKEALVFPNPGTDYLKMRVAAHYKKSIFELYDINGKIVLSEQIIGKWGEVNTVALKSGTYVYRIYNEEGLFESGKWLKK